MKIFDTTKISPDGSGLIGNEAYWIYNGLDCCLTAELRHAIKSRMDEVALKTYKQHLDMQAPILEMMLRGTKIDTVARTRIRKEAEKKRDKLQAILDRYCIEGLGLDSGINPGSHTQVKWLFYDMLRIPVIKEKNQAGVMAPSSSRDALEKLCHYLHAEPFARVILALRDQRKQIGFLNTELDKDKRIRCSFNLAGTNTGRLSSAFSDLGTGTNLQNIDRNLREIFVADPGKILVNIDLEQADSRNVGALCWNAFYKSHGEEFAGSYLDACESGDLHTTVTTMAWPDLDWSGDAAARRALADEKFYRTFSRRDLSKKLGHGSNYMVKPFAAAKHAQIQVAQAAEFQSRYFGAFPVIPMWQDATVNELQQSGCLINPFGRRRYFFGRLDDQNTLNAAIAYTPQSMTGEEINLGILNLWRNPVFELMIQVHDSILFQIPANQVNELVPLALDLMKIILPLKGGREFYVPLEAEVGWNWGKFDKRNPDKNPYGMKTWTGEETRTAPRYTHKKKLLRLEDYL